MLARRLATVCGASLFALGLIVAPAAADDCHSYDKPVNGRYSHTYEDWSLGPGWKIELLDSPGGRHEFWPEAETGNTFSPTAGISAREVSDAVGFDVTWSGVVSGAGYEVDVPPSARWTIEAGTIDDVFVFDIQTYNGCTGTTAGRPLQGTAEQTGSIVVRHYPSP